MSLKDISNKRQVDQWSESEFIQNRYFIWFGSDMPKTISAKEICDNGLDQLADRKNTKAKKSYITIHKNKIEVMDDGSGISLDLDEETGKSHMFLAVNKLYTSSNYEETDLTGVNGVGATATNALSDIFIAGNVKNKEIEGYKFNLGVHKDEGKTTDKIEGINLPFRNGFYVSAEYNETILPDEIDKKWLKEYIQVRVGELPKGSEVTVLIKGKDREKDEEVTFDKIKDSENYVPSWEESILAIPGTEIAIMKGGWKFAFNRKEDAFENMKSIVKKSPIQNASRFRSRFEIEEGTFITLSMPYLLYYDGKGLPPYKDQPKTLITIPASDIFTAMKLRTPKIYKFFADEAKDKYLKSLLKGNESKSYFPAIGSGKKELIIAEGFGAASTIKSMRDPKTQAVLGLQGKVLNVMRKDIKDAMKSMPIRDILTTISTGEFEKIIFATDADSDGNHISTLLLGLFHRFGTQYLEEGKVYYCHTPFYVFLKGKEMKWSNDAKDCPKGYRLSVKKGLGSLTKPEVEAFICDPKTRDLWQFEYDLPEAEERLKFALIEGGKGWVQ